MSCNVGFFIKIYRSFHHYAPGMTQLSCKEKQGKEVLSQVLQLSEKKTLEFSQQHLQSKYTHLYEF